METYYLRSSFIRKVREYDSPVMKDTQMLMDQMPYVLRMDGVQSFSVKVYEINIRTMM
ncbi:hypothetical protein E2320_010588 [Naja naja]|nr:hypothetical protein E2320_010588 [Naja naja]